MLLLPLLAACATYTTSVIAVPLAGDENGDAAPTVTVKNGTYTGLYSAGYDQDFFLGIPYAQKAIRFSQAQSLNTTWDGSKEATAYPNHCVGYGGDEIGYPLSEDCLYLNVIRPAGISNTSDLPVAVWIHGGGLYMGGSADRRYNLSFLLHNSVQQGTPILGVSLNYRLSAFGFLTGSEALEAGITNIGFRDQRLALHWINENIAAFGGSPDKVTIWGESSGAESVSAQVLAYNGRDDGLFRGAVGQSGFGGQLFRYAGAYNASADLQATFDSLVTNTSCAFTVGTLAAVDCLRNAPFDEINTALNVTKIGPWAPVLDHDFISDFPSNQLRKGRYPQIPILIGANTDEGTAFGSGRGPEGQSINTNAEFADAIREILPSDLAETSGQSVDNLVAEVEYLYPNIQSIGIPSLKDWPEVITNETANVTTFGLQYRRTNALFGDLVMHYLRRRANLAWSGRGLPSYSYRFDVTIPSIAEYVAATHFQEVAFVFYNLNGVGYSENPFGNSTQADKDLAFTISSAWINFFTSQDPNGDAVSPIWPVYDAADGGGVGQNIVWSVADTGSYTELDDYRAAGINWFIEHGLSVLGN